MHGLGNDFVVINGMDKEIRLSQEQCRKISDRHFGIGCDQILLLENSENTNMDVRYRIYNADGDEVEQCGNGIRCVGKYLSERGIIEKEVITAEVMNGVAKIYINGSDKIKVDMGIPHLEPADIPINMDKKQGKYSINTSDGVVTFAAVSMGNPHAIILVDDINEAPVESLGLEIQRLEIFPNSVNVGFMQIYDGSHIGLRVFERGVGETMACGTGACAALVAGNLYHGLEKEVDAKLKGGHMSVSWIGEGESVWMTGPAATVYEGQMNI
jgi:diaminopimelate epimerase